MSRSTNSDDSKGQGISLTGSWQWLRVLGQGRDSVVSGSASSRLSMWRSERKRHLAMTAKGIAPQWAEYMLPVRFVVFEMSAAPYLVAAPLRKAFPATEDQRRLSQDSQPLGPAHRQDPRPLPATDLAASAQYVSSSSVADHESS